MLRHHLCKNKRNEAGWPILRLTKLSPPLSTTLHDIAVNDKTLSVSYHAFLCTGAAQGTVQCSTWYLTFHTGARGTVLVFAPRQLDGRWFKSPEKLLLNR